MKKKEKKEKKAGNSFSFWRVCLTVIFSLLLTAVLVLLLFLLFIHALNDHVVLPNIGPISGDWADVFFDSWYSVILGGVLAMVPVVTIVLLNTRRIRRIFLAVGASAILSAIFSAAAVVIRIRIIQALSGEWQEVLINAAAAFKDFGVIYAMILIAVGAACLSIYFCVAAVKGGRHEKDY